MPVTARPARSVASSAARSAPSPARSVASSASTIVRASAAMSRRSTSAITTMPSPCAPASCCPRTYTYQDVPERFHARPGYRYVVINHHPVIVEPRTRRVVEVVE